MPETKRPLKVFLCHASADKPKVRELYRTLKRRGILPWLDAENLIPGQNWEVEIPKAILSSDAIIICLSPNSVDKEGYVQKEMKFALDKALEMPEGRIFLIPARLEECNLPFSLRQYQAVNLYEKEGYVKLMKALKLRASQLERATVELPKSGETTAEIKKVVEEKKYTKLKQENLKAEKPQPKKTKLPRKPNTAIIVALIGLIGTTIAALIGSPIIERWFSPTPVSTEVVTATTTLTFQAVASSETIQSNLTPITVDTLTPTALPTEITDVKGVSMVLVPAGGFTMGSESGDKDEEPAQRISLADFYIDKFEVTNRFYKACADAAGCTAPKNLSSASRENYYGGSQYDDYPVVYVDWAMAKTYCEWRSAHLPTEKEWEKAARGPRGSTYPWGEVTPNKTWANFGDNSGNTTPVGFYENGKSIYSVHDMAGNIAEWVEDWYDVYPGGYMDASTDFGTKFKVIRGGSWRALVFDIRSPARGHQDLVYTSNSVGFRCARNVNP